MSLNIEAGIPIPPHGAAGVPKRPRDYPFAQMRIGDSFLVPEGEPPRRVAVAASTDSKTSRRRYAIRTMADGRVRCWRVA